MTWKSIRILPPVPRTRTRPSALSRSDRLLALALTFPCPLLSPPPAWESKSKPRRQGAPPPQTPPAAPKPILKAQAAGTTKPQASGLRGVSSIPFPAPARPTKPPQQQQQQQQPQPQRDLTPQEAQACEIMGDTLSSVMSSLFVGGHGGSCSNKLFLKLRLDLNLEVEVSMNTPDKAKY
ncbi:hypothetical protein B0H19DRAFT_1258401 [Mycena capillaripes]|nr:hypothetical protein B0H19DRAFT_1258401 [Mycena capillaripes]